MPPTKIPLTDVTLGDDEIVEVELSAGPWGQQILHVNIGGACALRIANGKMFLSDRRWRIPESSSVKIESPTQSLEDVMLHIRFGRSHDAAVLTMSHQAMVKIRALVDKHFPQTPPLNISYIEGDTSTACTINVGSKEHVVAFLFKPRPVV